MNLQLRRENTIKGFCERRQVERRFGRDKRIIHVRVDTKSLFYQ